MKDTVKRSFVKTVTWRVIAVLSSFIVTFVMIGSLHQSVSLTLGVNLSAMVLYYFHERVWNVVKWGKYDKKR